MASYSVFLTGRPGVGKTSILLYLVEELRKRGYKVGGMISCEIRQGRRRVGFKIRDIASGREGILAHVNQSEGPRVSKYRVNLRDLNEVGVKAIERAMLEDDVIVIDEVGKMELFSREFVSAVKEALSSNKVVLGSVHLRAHHPLAKQIREGRIKGIRIYEVTLANRNHLCELLLNEILEALEKNANRRSR
ncbi:MAG: NTPase [Thermoprotei archaeon]|nr:NTPase [Thermoprotei archaeon]